MATQIVALLLTVVFVVGSITDKHTSNKELKHAAKTNTNERHPIAQKAYDLDPSPYTTVYSSCNEIQTNGLYYIKPLPHLPVLPVICSNGFAMLDASLDINLNSFPSYLTSWDYGRINTDYILSALDDTSTFRQWFIPADGNTKFYIAPQCMECEAGEFDANTVYYIDSHTYCFSGAIMNGCIEDTLSARYHLESCNTCDVGIFEEDDQNSNNWIKCMALQMDADHLVDHDHITCVAHGLTFHPVLSTIRDACTCYQPLEATGVLEYQVLRDELPLVTAKEQDIINYGYTIANNILFDPTYNGESESMNVIDARDTNIVHLTNNDFMDGTYRITESGTYIITEDIVFNFNAPSEETMSSDDFSPNSIDVDELYWFPTREQANVDGEYPGLYSFSGAFTLGFFAGITIETDYVTIDLNGFSLKQDYKFYFQQRFFALIELASQPFVPGQGPANWGAGNDVYANHVVIKNGYLGLSSHHAIHGNNNNDVTITGVAASRFDVAGIQCNACTHVTVSDCVIGPQNQDIPVLGRYTHARSYLPRLKLLMDAHGSDEITFYNREAVRVSSLIDRLILQMDMMYFDVINGAEYDEMDDEWIAAKKLLYNPSGWLDGGSSYGILFGGSGAQVVGIGARHDDSSDVNISNVEIYGIYNAVIEKVKFTASFGATRLIFFDAMDWMATSDQVDDIATSEYIGDAYSDLTFAISQVVDSWYFMNSLYVSPEMEAHVLEGDNVGFGSIFKQPTIASTHKSKSSMIISGCGTDIQLHSSKGAIGLRVDGTQHLNVDTLYVHDVYNWAELGSETWCGAYPGPMVGNEDIEIQYGYTGTRAHGVVMDYVDAMFRDITIENIESYHGEANGMTVYKESQVTLENIQVDSVRAGTHLTHAQVSVLQSPNLRPRACGVDIRPNTMVTINEERGIINGDNIIGFDNCLNDAHTSSWQIISSVELICVVIVLSVLGNLLMDKFKTKTYKKVSEETPLLSV
eukprot:244933_1